MATISIQTSRNIKNGIFEKAGLSSLMYRKFRTRSNGFQIDKTYTQKKTHTRVDGEE